MRPGPRASATVVIALVGSALSAAATAADGSAEQRPPACRGRSATLVGAPRLISWWLAASRRHLASDDGVVMNLDTGQISQPADGIVWGFEVIVGTRGSDRITGSARAETMYGRGDVDVLRGRGGRDAVDGGAGNDRLTGGARRDRSVGGAGFDLCSAEVERGCEL